MPVLLAIAVALILLLPTVNVDPIAYRYRHTPIHTICRDWLLGIYTMIGLVKTVQGGLKEDLR